MNNQFCIAFVTLFLLMENVFGAGPVNPLLEAMLSMKYDDGSPLKEWHGCYDTICVVGGKTYFYGYYEMASSGAIFDENKFWVKAPALECFPYSDESSTKFYVCVPYKCLLVDFSDKKSVAQLSTLSKQILGFERYNPGGFTKKDIIAQYYFEVDFPTEDVPNAIGIRQWLVEKIGESNSNNVDVPFPSSLYINYKKGANDYWIFTGNVNYNYEIAQFAADLYFGITRANHYVDIEDGYTVGFYQDLNLQAVECNDRFVTYLQCESEYSGGTHGYYSGKLISFDHVHNEEIDNSYLFKPGYQTELLDLLVDEAKKSPYYKEWEPSILEGVADLDKNGNVLGGYSFPQPGLTKEGLVFSFQPYEISCFAAGTFHFIIPYKRLKPLLTDRAIWCFKLQ